MPEYLSPERTQRLADLRRKYHRLAPYIERGVERVHVASVATCMKLFDASDWRDTFYQWSGYRTRDGRYEPGMIEYRLEEIEYYVTCFVPSLDEDERWVASYPAYDLSYLIRKFAGNGAIEIRHETLGTLATWFRKPSINCLAGTPEEAVALLAIKLFEQGIFTRDVHE